MFHHNPDYRRRERLLGLDENIWDDEDNIFDVIRVDHLSIAVLEKLLEEKFINPDGRQNESPSAIEFIRFMRKYPSVQAHGYAVSPYHDDYRVTIEGLYVGWRDCTADMRTDFEEFCANADCLEIESDPYSWWD